MRKIIVPVLFLISLPCHAMEISDDEPYEMENSQEKIKELINRLIQIEAFPQIIEIKQRPALPPRKKRAIFSRKRAIDKT